MTSIKELQEAIGDERLKRGFTKDSLRIFALLSEEVGEVARELKKAWSPNYDDSDPMKIAEELADCLVALCALASAEGVDLQDAVDAKFFKTDAAREWVSAKRPVVDP